MSEPSPLIEKEARAERLRRARLLAGLSRKEMGESAIHSDTYKGWEAARFGGLTDKGAQKVIEKFRIHGVSCSLSWLLHGVGIPPFLNQSAGLDSDQSEEIFSCLEVDRLFAEEAAQISRELAAFRIQERSIDFCIADDLMGPWYLPGDLVAGIKIPLKFGARIPDGFDCIVQLASGEVLLRRVHQGQSFETYNLLTHKSGGPVIAEVRLDFLAPVLWWRRPMKTVLG
jgi:hypothetical protein